jgi:hypothetical protein
MRTLDLTMLPHIEYKSPNTELWHRADGPALIFENGNTFWFHHGTKHRYYGPFNKFEGWYIHGSHISRI